MKKCFLCEVELDNKNSSKEHIFPKWLLKECKLYNDKLYFLNGKTMSYGKITIPCCYICNQKLKKNLEDIVSKNKNFNSFKKVPKTTIFHWLIKIFLCILYRELCMDIDPKDKNKGKILDKNLTDKFELLQTFLKNSLDKKIKYRKPYPFSLFIYKIKNTNKNNFNFSDNVLTSSISLTYGDVGIICILRDNNSQEQALKNFYFKFKNNQVSPIQFNELTAYHFYTASLFNRTPKYLIAESLQNLYEVVSIPTQGLSSIPFFNSGNINDYKIFLNKYRPIDKTIKIPEDKYLSFLWDENGKFKK